MPSPELSELRRAAYACRDAVAAARLAGHTKRECAEHICNALGYAYDTLPGLVRRAIEAGIR